MNTDGAKKQYDTLLGKIVDLGERQEAEYGDQIRCGLGCDGCCKPPDSLFLVEAGPLQDAIAALPDEQKATIRAQLEAYETQTREQCPLLLDGGCSVYNARPTICRTHGYALWQREEDTMSWCPLNFTEVTPQKDSAFDLDRLNQMLALITQLTWPQDEGRRDLTQLIHEALSS